MQTITITIYSDYICPFCYIGKGLIDILEKEFSLSVDWLPFELHEKTPAAGRLWSDLYKGMNYENFFNNMTGRGEEAGIVFTPQPMLYNSNMALQAGEFAKENASHGAFHDAVFKAYFVDCRNISELENLKAIADEVGMDAQALESALRDGKYAPRIEEVAAEAKKKGISSAPTFEIQGYGNIIGPKPLEVFRTAFAEVLQGSEGKQAD